MKRGHREIFHIVSSSKSVLECRKGLGRYRVVFGHRWADRQKYKSLLEISGENFKSVYSQELYSSQLAQFHVMMYKYLEQILESRNKHC